MKTCEREIKFCCYYNFILIYNHGLIDVIYVKVSRITSFSFENDHIN